MADEVMDLPQESAELDAGTIEQTPDAETASNSEDESSPSNPYTTKFSREMRAALKQWEQSSPEAARFARHLRDNHARMFALTQLEPKGIDGVRERYDLLNSLAFGESKGVDAISAMQQRIEQMDEVDARFAAGDPEALTSLGEEFNAGLAKIAPAYLDRIQAADPEAYNAAILPHFVSALAKSDLVREFNEMVDVLNRQPPQYLTPEQKSQWVQEQLQGVYGAVGKMAGWFNAQQQKAQELRNGKGLPEPKTSAASSEPPLAEREQAFHWDTKIKPEAVKLENARFADLLKPIAARLQLNDRQKAAALSDFKSRIADLMRSDADYMRSIQNYRRQSNPDPAAVLNLIKSKLASASQRAFDEMKEDRGWSNFLRGKGNGTASVNRSAQPMQRVESGVEVRTVKPPMNEIDHKNTPIEWLRVGKYRLNSGKVIQVARGNA